MAHSSAAEPVASPGARIGPGVPVSTRTAAWRVDEGRGGIDVVRGIGRRLDEIVEAAGRGERVVLERRQPAFAIHAEPQLLARRAPMADRAVHLVARQHQLDRARQHARGEDRQNVVAGQKRLRAEAAAEEGAAQKDVFGRDAEEAGNAAHATWRWPGWARRRSAGRRPTPRRWHAAPWRCDTAPASRTSRRRCAAPPHGRRRYRPCRTRQARRSRPSPARNAPRRRGRPAPAGPRSAAQAAARLRSPPPASRPRRARSACLA